MGAAVLSKITIIDFGGQYAHLIARRIRELGVYSDIKLPDSQISDFDSSSGIILSGSPYSVYSEKAPVFNTEIFELNVPILGLCYGHQLIAKAYGGKVKPGSKKEYGITEMEIIHDNPLFKGLNKKQIVWMSHGDNVTEMPLGFEHGASSQNCRIAAMANVSKRIYSVQFHPEVSHTPNGMQILKNFLDICKCTYSWGMRSYLDEIIKEIKNKVGQRSVFMLVSGGVDSSVGFTLIEKALGKDRVYGLHIDNGFMRKNESSLVFDSLKKLGFGNLHIADYSKEFLTALKGVADPEQKRKIIGKIFIEAQTKELKKLRLDEDKWILGQGTIYPDTIESSGTKHSDLIKTHHNRVEAIQKLISENKIIEPLANLYKDEVRKVGEFIGLPKDLVFRHPFPGPGLAIRCLCSQGNNISEMKEPMILPIKSVGVQGDERSYKHCACITGILDWEELEKASVSITNSNFNINRVVAKIYPSSDNEIKGKKAYLTKERLDLLREIDFRVNNIIRKYNLEKQIWQFPIILIPVGYKHLESAVLRPICSNEAMTANFYKMDTNVLQEIIKELSQLDIDYIFYDITNKPPATIEWE